MSQAIENLFREERTFPPAAAFTAQANAQPGIHAAAQADWLRFWEQQAKERVTWFKEPTSILDDSDPPFYKWFSDGELNISYNCLDRHLSSIGDKVAYHFVGEPGDRRTITYRELHAEVCRFANALKSLGVEKGDRVAIYMGMVPELPIAMLACARIGAGHTVVFGGFSADALAGRIEDTQARVVVTQDGAWRRGQVVPLKVNSDLAVARCPSVEHVVVLRRTDNSPEMTPGRDLWWHELVPKQSSDCPPAVMNAEDLLYVLYTSGTTAKPKGIVHTQGGYLVGVTTTHSYVFDVKPDDVFWCAADVGWVTGHSYIVYGPLLNGATAVMYEGTPDYPEKDRFWAIVEKYGVNVIYTAPTAIRTFMKWGPDHPRRHDLSSLRLLGTVGEPINPEAWVWYYRYIGGERCPVVDTWWQTETGMILISPLPGITTLKPGSATRALPGISAEIVNEQGRPVGPNEGGYLVLTRPWPAMLRGIYGDPERYQQQYWNRFPGMYFTGDGAKRDEDGYIWLLGRVDDVINVAGHRIGTYEVESALVDHPSVAEAAVIGVSHDIKGQAIAAFVTLKEGNAPGTEAVETLKQHVVKKIGALARPEQILFTGELPKTRSGKIMRRLLRDIAEGRIMGDTTTLADPNVVEALKNRYEEEVGS